MFKSLKRRGEKVKERVDFKFGFHATRVPHSGWEKLVVSVIPLETGRVSYKTTRAVVKNGSCNWGDNVIETTKLLRDTKTKEYDEKLYKFILSTGSSRSGVLGDAVVNVADYTASNNPQQIALTLKNCNTGTILHATITCLTPRTNSGRDLERTRANDLSDLLIEEGDDVSGSDDEDMEDSDQSGNLTTGSATSNTSAPIPSQSNSLPKDRSGGSRISAVSIDPLEPSTPRQNGNGRAFASDNVPSPTSSMNSSGRHDRDRDRVPTKTLTSQDSNNSSTSLPPAYGRGPANANGNSGTMTYSSRSIGNEREWPQTQRSIGSRAPSENGSRASSQNDLGGREALQADLAAAETTIEELRMETVSTQRQNRKLTTEIENLKQQLNTHIRQGDESGLEMRTLVAERDRLRQELEQVRSSMMALEERETGEGNARWKADYAQQTIRELTDEVRYQKDLNMSLGTQVRKTQDSNMELVLAIKDVEDSLEQHRKEIETLTEMNHKLQESLSSKQRDSLDSLADLEQEWKQKFVAVEDEKKALESQLASFVDSQQSSNSGDQQRIKSLEKMVERLTQDIEELEKESKELANENMELYTTLESSKKEKARLMSQLENGGTMSSESLSSERSFSEDAEVARLKRLVTEIEAKLAASEDSQKKQLARNKQHVEDMQTLVAELRTGNELLERQLEKAEAEAQRARAQAEEAKSRLAALENGHGDDRYSAELERKLSEARQALAEQQQELSSQEESASRAEEERSIALDKIAGLEDDMLRLKTEIRSIVDARARAETMVAQLQREKEELEERLRGAAAETGEAAEQIQERKAEVAHMYQRSASQMAKVRELEECLLELDGEKAALESKVRDLLEGERLSKSRIQELELQLSVLTEEMESVDFSKREFEERVTQLERARINLEDEKRELEVKLQAGDGEDKLRQEHITLLQAELQTLRGQVETHSNSRRNLERKTSELENAKDDLESQLTDLEEENLKLSERIAGLEAQLRYVTEERESHKSDKSILEVRLQDIQSQKSKAEGALLATTKEHHLRVTEWEARFVSLVEEKQQTAFLQQELQRQLEKQAQESAGYVDMIRGLKERISHLEKLQVGQEANLHNLSEDYTVASKTISSLEGQMLLLRTENEEKTGKFLAEIESLKQENNEAEQRVKRAEESLRRTRWEKAAAIERMQEELQRLTEQMSSTQDEKEKMASQALVEASELRAEKAQWEEKFRQMEGKVRQADEECSTLKSDYGSRMQDLIIQNEGNKSREQEITFKLTESLRELGDLKTKEAASRSQSEEAEKTILIVSDENKSLMQELDELQMKVQDVEMLSMELQRLQSAFERVKAERDTLDASSRNINVLNEYLQEEKSQLEEDITAWQQENEELKHAKGALEEKLMRLQLELETQGTSRIQDSEQRNESIKLRRQNTEFKQKLSEQEEEKEEFRRRVQSLEEELQEKTEALGTVERKLRERDYEENARPLSNGGSPRFLQRSLSRSNSKINPMNGSSSREAKELSELREKVKLLEGDIKSKAMALDALKREFSDKEATLYNKIELLEMANEQLIQGGPDLGMDQLQMELQRLQNQNSVLARRERELVSQLSTQEVLHKEVQRLQEENEQLETRFNRFKETAKFGNLMDRVVNLETELAEAMEANTMYKTQLRNAFATQQNVQAAALQNYGDVDQIITDLVRLKGHSSKLEGDVKDLRERYATMSLRYAEVEAQREELVMTVRNLRNGKKV